ncbi:hypothetical protein Cpin_2653 [Chitinophaga pinensis DSM 2588]|uniref:Uncharacterized protein n=1 Tax=Chitinophaga pinensis (strain ATCC 43595 / DSM 2588 / LMG 13176 / NBRC 15968 / NCIMB 11800 / UQM 2034) TaxID=485918 RepID=A0A979G3I4_CHIPD|nr:hypothetical protein Cpin_2653 [Chitinophaga pinensis DSM 2588]
MTTVAGYFTNPDTTFTNPAITAGAGSLNFVV